MTADSSVLVALYATWHDHHVEAAPHEQSITAIVAHAELEAYSVLTRLPPEVRAPADVVAEWFRRQHPGRRLRLDADQTDGLVSRLAGHGISGGAVYDAMIALTAAEHGLELLTFDRRAVAVYDRLGVDYRLLG